MTVENAIIGCIRGVWKLKHEICQMSTSVLLVLEVLRFEMMNENFRANEELEWNFVSVWDCGSWDAALFIWVWLTALGVHLWDIWSDAWACSGLLACNDLRIYDHPYIFNGSWARLNGLSCSIGYMNAIALMFENWPLIWLGYPNQQGM